MKIDQKLLRIMSVIAGVFIIIVLVIVMITTIIKNKKLNLEDFEFRIVTLAEKYYKSNESVLPSEGDTVSVSIQHFLDNKSLKRNVLKTGETCYGEVKVTNNNGYYLYLPFLKCDDNEPKLLADVLTADENIVNSSHGLYNYNNTYIYRGEVDNNYVSFANKLWRILRINEDGTIRMMDINKDIRNAWDNRYNSEERGRRGLNDYVQNDDINSRIKDKLEKMYNDDRYFTDKNRAYLTKHDLCVGKRNIEDEGSDGLIECADIIPNQMLGLIQVNEIMLASLDDDCTKPKDRPCTNYNYLTNFENATWTITADSETSYKVFTLTNSINVTDATNLNPVKAVVHLTEHALYSSGSGTQDDPYIIK